MPSVELVDVSLVPLLETALVPLLVPIIVGVLVGSAEDIRKGAIAGKTDKGESAEDVVGEGVGEDDAVEKGNGAGCSNMDATGLEGVLGVSEGVSERSSDVEEGAGVGKDAIGEDAIGENGIGENGIGENGIGENGMVVGVSVCCAEGSNLTPPG